jgi:transposase-like protein
VKSYETIFLTGVKCDWSVSIEFLSSKVCDRGSYNQVFKWCKSCDKTFTIEFLSGASPVTKHLQ